MLLELVKYQIIFCILEFGIDKFDSRFTKCLQLILPRIC